MPITAGKKNPQPRCESVLLFCYFKVNEVLQTESSYFSNKNKNVETVEGGKERKILRGKISKVDKREINVVETRRKMKREGRRTNGRGTKNTP